WALPAAAGLLVWLPASNLILLSPVLMAERLAYLPSIFACVLAGGLYARLAAGRGPGASPGWPFGKAGLHMIVILAVAAMGARTFVRAGDFHSDLTLYRSDTRSCPRSVKAAYNLGNALSRDGFQEEAAASFERAVSLAPWLGIAWSNLGSARLQLGRMDEAEDAYREAVKADPTLVTARASLAGLLYLGGRLDEALAQAQAALDLNPPEGDAAQLRELIARIRKRLSPPPSAAGP
ncbi:MAG TPA: tetratricopeptide repeat protein, partial [Candidatus Saccharimonadales bacterium]|nr:tetratricopeptide repeat protein [Candidatus Saccharimonadales bacterium]